MDRSQRTSSDEGGGVLQKMTWEGGSLDNKERNPNYIIFGKIIDFPILKPNIC